MIKIAKDRNQVPASLNSRLTKQRREELVQNGAYIDDSKYNDRYKTKDVREALGIYNSKCAFCEQKVEELHIEHFRPKKIYYWLTYSWDNLLLSLIHI